MPKNLKPDPSFKKWSEGLRSLDLGASRDDEALVRECLLGSEGAFSEIVEKYRNIIFSIPLRYGLSSEAAANVFQSVCLSIVRDLHTLREPQALSAWLIRLTLRKSTQLRRESIRFGEEHFQDSSLDHRGVVRNIDDERAQVQANVPNEGIAEILKIATGVFENPELALKWLSRPNLFTDNKPPITLLNAREGFERVRQLLMRIEYGNVA